MSTDTPSSRRFALWCSESAHRAVRAAAASRGLSVSVYLDLVVLPVVRQDVAISVNGTLPAASPDVAPGA